jgi:hypothetical protein
MLLFFAVMVLAALWLYGAVGEASNAFVRPLLLGSMTLSLLLWYLQRRQKPPDPADAPVCPQCGVRMMFVQYQPDAQEYRCAGHGPYMLDSQGLFTLPERRPKARG